MRTFAPLLFFCLVFSASVAEVRLSKAFSDNMVLQRQLPIKIWGWADAKEKVTLQLGKSKAKVQPGKNGYWLATLPPMEAGGPYSLTVQGKNSLLLSNILIGEVWLAGGQSNMEWKLGNNINNHLQEILDANYPQIRVLNVDNKTAFTPLPDIESKGWKVCSPGTAGDFSAVAYFFARHLWNKFKVPVGIIQSEWGGTPAEAWTSVEALATMPDFAGDLEEVKKWVKDPLSSIKDSPEAKLKYSEAIAQHDLGLQEAENARWYQPNINESDWKPIQVPGLFDSEVYPGFDGLVWYRKTIELPAQTEGLEGSITLGKIDDADSVWVNGVIVGGLFNPRWGRRYVLPKGIIRSGKNTIAVRVHDSGGEGGFISTNADVYLSVGSGNFPLAGEWLSKPSAQQNLLHPPPTPILFHYTATCLYNAMLKPIVPFGIKGAIWYQGESNAAKAWQYRTLFPLMINDWRKQWNQGDFPFLFVQLANFRKADSEPTESEWAELREAQTQTLSLPNTGMANIIDIGEAGDIHPKNKQDVGFRLGLQAQRVAYGDKNVVADGPTFKNARRDGNSMRILFDHIGSGLMLNDKYGYVKGFAVAGEDGKYYYASGKLDGNEVVLQTSKVPEPKYVRYAWANNPDDANLYNKEGLPAGPFRTDTFKGLTQP